MIQTGLDQLFAYKYHRRKSACINCCSLQCPQRDTGCSVFRIAFKIGQPHHPQCASREEGDAHDEFPVVALAMQQRENHFAAKLIRHDLHHFYGCLYGWDWSGLQQTRLPIQAMLKKR